jgi:ribose transport system substrate-binding protein
MLARRVLLGTTAAAMAIVAVGCGSGNSSSSSGGGGGGNAVPSFAKNFKAPASGCGSYDAPMPPDPQGVVAALPADHRAGYAGVTNYPGSSRDVNMVKSRWSNWKPKNPKHWTIGLIGPPPVNDFAAQFMKDVPADLKKDPNVKTVIVAAPNGLDTAQQLQQYKTVSQSGVDMMIAFPGQPQPFKGSIKENADKDIPTLSASVAMPTADAVSVTGNLYLGGADTASYAAKLLGGKGNWLYVHGVGGTSPDLLMQGAWDSVAKSCPGIKVLKDAVYGGFSDSIAKSYTLRYLASHPQPIDAAMEVSNMASGVMGAFQQAGRKMPVVTDSGMAKGSLGYWNQHRGEYHGVGTTIPPVGFSAAVAEIALRMLEGQGVKLNNLVTNPPFVTDANLEKWVEPSWTLTTPGVASGTRNDFMPSSYIDAFFNNPAPVK